jgi:hypothetical protein
MYDIPFDRSFLQLSNGIRHVMPSTDTKPELTAKASMAQPVSQPAVYASGLSKSALRVFHSMNLVHSSFDVLAVMRLMILFVRYNMLHQ